MNQVGEPARDGLEGSVDGWSAAWIPPRVTPPRGRTRRSTGGRGVPADAEFHRRTRRSTGGRGDPRAGRGGGVRPRQKVGVFEFSLRS